MTVTAELLREIHRIHEQLADLNERLERGPKQIRAREANVTKFKDALSEAEQQTQQARMAGDQKQLDLQASEGKIEDLRGKLNTSSTNKEFHALQEQIAATEMANSVLADEILETFEKVDQLQIAVAKAKEDLAAGEAQLAKFAKQQAEDEKLMRLDIVRLEADLAAGEKQLSGDYREDYNRVIRNKGADGMSAAEGRVCTGCGQQMTLNMQNDLMLSKPSFCKACGRMLYVAE